MNAVNPAPRYSIREQFQNSDKQLQEALSAAGLTCDLFHLRDPAVWRCCYV
jgi:hypothetical protein